MSQSSSYFATLIRECDRLTANTPELTNEERQAYFGHLTHDQREQVADLFWRCADSAQRQKIYSVLRGWLAEFVRLN